jgi:hypothetical protein
MRVVDPARLVLGGHGQHLLLPACMGHEGGAVTLSCRPQLQ